MPDSSRLNPELSCSILQGRWGKLDPTAGPILGNRPSAGTKILFADDDAINRMVRTGLAAYFGCVSCRSCLLFMAPLPGPEWLKGRLACSSLQVGQLLFSSLGFDVTVVDNGLKARSDLSSSGLTGASPAPASHKVECVYPTSNEYENLVAILLRVNRRSRLTEVHRSLLCFSTVRWMCASQPSHP